MTNKGNHPQQFYLISSSSGNSGNSASKTCPPTPNHKSNPTTCHYCFHAGPNTVALTWIAINHLLSDLPDFTHAHLDHIMPSTALLKSPIGSQTSCNIKAKVFQRYRGLHDQCFSYSLCPNCFLSNHAHSIGILTAGSLSAMPFTY